MTREGIQAFINDELRTHIMSHVQEKCKDKADMKETPFLADAPTDEGKEDEECHVVDGWDKLIVRPDSLELYDLKNDPDDRTDLAQQDPEKVQELSALMKGWLDATPIVFPPAGDKEQ